MSTKTSSFGVSKRESHDSSKFYSRRLYDSGMVDLLKTLTRGPGSVRSVPRAPVETWADKVYLHTSEDMVHVPDDSVAAVFTSPPYNVGKDYDEDSSLKSYLEFISRVGTEVFRVLRPGGRYVINVANLGRKPYVPLHACFYMIHTALGFMPAGEVIWQKGKGANSSCAWGSWLSARAPRLRDIHEYLLVFVKDSFSRPDKGTSDISREEFMKSTLSVWEIPPESARRIGHPAPFPVELALRVIRLYSYVGDVILDPFVGSGTTCVAAKQSGRHYVGYEIVEDYVNLSRRRLGDTPG